MDLNHVKKLLSRKPENIESRIRSDFSMVLNLLLSQTPDDVKAIFEKSLATFQSHSQAVRRGGSLWDDFCRHLDFLKAEGFVDDQDRLTDNGHWASKLRLGSAPFDRGMPETGCPAPGGRETFRSCDRSIRL